MLLANYFQRGERMETLKDKIRELEREEIIKALRDSGWVMAKAARKLGITERVIGYKINKYGIRTKEVRWAVQGDNPEMEELRKELP
jgi:transcriptional regulator with GAF, ATPase, and Fis domain